MLILRLLSRALRALGRGLLFIGRASGRGLLFIGRASRRGLAWLTGLRGDLTPQGRERRQLALQRLAWVAALILVGIAFGTSGTVYDTDTLGYGLMPFVGLIVGLPFGLIATRPLTGLVISVGGAFVLTLLPFADRDPWPWLVVHGLVMFALLFATCAREPLGRAVGAWLITASLFAWGPTPDVRTGWIIGLISIAVTGALVGRLVRTRRALVAQEEVSSVEKARRVVLEERARIARDLHDIVAHHMSLVVVQAETAGFRVPDLSDSARAELLSIGETARSALTETRALLSVLRQEGQELPAAPQPGLQQVGDLVDAARRAGVRLEVQIDGDLERLRPGVSLAAYRIVQEALANASRHASGASVRLEIEASRPAVRVLVRNGPMPDGRRRPGLPEPAAVDGHGITGMRERAAAAGGRLTLGPTGDGGFAVELILPTDGEEARAESGPDGVLSVVDPAGRSVLAPDEGTG